MAGTSRGNTYNLVSVFFWRVSSTGINYGQLDPAATETGNTTSHALAFIGDAIASGVPEVTYKQATFGGSRQLGSAFMGINPIGTFDIQLSSMDATLINMAKGGNIDTTTVSGATLFSQNNNAQSPNDMGLMYSRQIQDRESGSDGDTKYITTVIPRCQVFVTDTGGNTTDGENPQPVTVTVTASMAEKHPWGASFGTNEGFAGNKTDHYYLTAEYPYGLTTWIANGVATTYDVEFDNATTSVTSGNTDNIFSINGTVTAPSSFASKTVTIAAAGSDGDNHTAMYQMSVPIT